MISYQFEKISHITYTHLDMPEADVDLLARPGKRYRDPGDWSLIGTYIKAKEHIYQYDIFIYGTAADIAKHCPWYTYEWNEEQDRHIFRFRPAAEIHFLDGSTRTIYFDTPDDTLAFNNHMKTICGLDKEIHIDHDRLQLGHGMIK